MICFFLNRDLLLKNQPKDLDFATVATPDQMKEMFNTKGLDGTVYDYFDGFKDLQKRRVAFVGDANTRIQEDYLRILRYFRFFGRISERPDGHEQETLQAIKDNVKGLERISGERIWSELRKILEGRFAGELLKTMLSLGIGPYIGLPAQPNMNEFDRLMNQEHSEQLHPMTLLSALFINQEEFHSRVRLSTYDRDLGLFVVEHRMDKPSIKPIRPYQLLVVNCKTKISDTREWVRELLKYRGNIELLKEFDNWIMPRFPLNGNILIKEHGVPGGKSLGPVLNALKKKWVESDFQLSSDELLKSLPEILEEVGIQKR
ncbi:hypothetical protein C0J52_14861 [Blattella germanica]|nr:hypothetical protein C0J52_14861 [Blattella germanica]